MDHHLMLWVRSKTRSECRPFATTKHMDLGYQDSFGTPLATIAVTEMELAEAFLEQQNEGPQPLPQVPDPKDDTIEEGVVLSCAFGFLHFRFFSQKKVIFCQKPRCPKRCFSVNSQSLRCGKRYLEKITPQKRNISGKPTQTNGVEKGIKKTRCPTKRHSRHTNNLAECLPLQIQGKQGGGQAKHQGWSHNGS